MVDVKNMYVNHSIFKFHEPIFNIREVNLINRKLKVDVHISNCLFKYYDLDSLGSNRFRSRNLTEESGSRIKTD